MWSSDSILTDLPFECLSAILIETRRRNGFFTHTILDRRAELIRLAYICIYIYIYMGVCMGKAIHADKRRSKRVCVVEWTYPVCFHW